MNVKPGVKQPRTSQTARFYKSAGSKDKPGDAFTIIK